MDQIMDRYVTLARGRLQIVQKSAPNKAWFQFQKIQLANRSHPIPFNLISVGAMPTLHPVMLQS